MILIPRLDDPDLTKLINAVGLSSKPLIINVKPESFAQEQGCFPAIEEKIKKDGGERVLGWQIWKSDITIEAEFHAIWKSLNNELVDITPKSIPISPGVRIPVVSIVFIPDARIEYRGAQIDNVRLNITGNSLVDNFIKLAEAKFRLLNKGNRALEYAVVLSREEQKSLGSINLFQGALYAMIQAGANENSGCFCRSGKKYKGCCHEKITDIITE